MAAQAVAAVASGLLPIIGAAIGAAIAQGDEDRARYLREMAVEQFGPEIMPKLDKMVAEQQGASEFGKIQEDPQFRAAQTAALRKLEEQAFTQGMTPEEEADFYRAQQQAGSFASGQQQAAMRQMSQRGMSGGGLEAALMMGAGQAAANRMTGAGLEAASQASQRRRGALGQYADLAGSVRGQEYGMAAKRAEAQDLINRFNTQQQSEAQKYNLGLSQQQFENEMRRRQEQEDRRQGLISDYESGARRTREMWGGFGQAAGQASGAAGKYAGGK